MRQVAAQTESVYKKPDFEGRNRNAAPKKQKWWCLVVMSKNEGSDYRRYVWLVKHERSRGRGKDLWQGDGASWSVSLMQISLAGAKDEETLDVGQYEKKQVEAGRDIHRRWRQHQRRKLRQQRHQWGLPQSPSSSGCLS